MKKNNFKNHYFAILGIIFFSFSFSLIVFSPISFQNIALALTGDYSKNNTTNANLDFSDWNNLASDFLDKDSLAGDSMAGPLTLPSDPISNMQAATKQYVDSNSGGNSGEVYTNWGVDSCGGDQKLYGGFVFGSHYLQPHGSESMFCLEPGDAGVASTIDMDKISPAVIGFGIPGTNVYEEFKVECATCFRSNSTCYETWGSDSCNVGAGFNPIYQGYIYGGAVAQYGDNRDNNTERHCINNNFNQSTPSTQWGSVFYPTEISDSADIPYTPDTYIKCALCCN